MLDQYGKRLVTTRVFDITGGATPETFIIETKGLSGRRYHVRFVEDRIVGCHGGADLRQRAKHVYIAAENALRDHFHKGAEGLCDEQVRK